MEYIAIVSKRHSVETLRMKENTRRNAAIEAIEANDLAEATEEETNRRPESTAEAIDITLILLPIIEAQTMPEPSPICMERYDTTIEDGIIHKACLLPDCKHMLRRPCISE